MSRLEGTVLLISEIVEEVLRRGNDPNAFDALDLLQREVSAWGERRIQLVEAWQNIVAINALLAETPRGAPPGALMRLHYDRLSPRGGGAHEEGAGAWTHPSGWARSFVRPWGE